MFCLACVASVSIAIYFFTSYWISEQNLPTWSQFARQNVTVQFLCAEAPSRDNTYWYCLVDWLSVRPVIVSGVITYHFFTSLVAILCINCLLRSQISTSDYSKLVMREKELLVFLVLINKFMSLTNFSKGSAVINRLVFFARHTTDSRYTMD